MYNQPSVCICGGSSSVLLPPSSIFFYSFHTFDCLDLILNISIIFQFSVRKFENTALMAGQGNSLKVLRPLNADFVIIPEQSLILRSSSRSACTACYWYSPLRPMLDVDRTQHNNNMRAVWYTGLPRRYYKPLLPLYTRIPRLGRGQKNGRAMSFDRRLVQMSRTPGAGSPRKDYNLQQYNIPMSIIIGVILHRWSRRRIAPKTGRLDVYFRAYLYIYRYTRSLQRGPCEPDMHARFDRTILYYDVVCPHVPPASIGI